MADPTQVKNFDPDPSQVKCTELKAAILTFKNALILSVFCFNYNALTNSYHWPRHQKCRLCSFHILLDCNTFWLSFVWRPKDVTKDLLWWWRHITCDKTKLMSLWPFYCLIYWRPNTCTALNCILLYTPHSSIYIG